MGHKQLLFYAITVTAMLGLTGCASAHLPATQELAEGQAEITVVTTSVAISEILDQLAYDAVIGVPETQHKLPERYEGLPTVGAPMNPDIEILKRLNPALVLSPATLEGSLSEVYKTADLTADFLDFSSVEGMYEAITKLGEQLHREPQAKILTAEYEQLIEETKIEQKQPEILLLMAFPDGFHLVATEDSYVGDLVRLAGGKNVYGSGYQGDESGFAAINPEDLIQKDPDLILVFAHYSEEAAFAYMEGAFQREEIWQHMRAVDEGTIHYLSSNLFGMSATLSWSKAVEYLRTVFYGN